MRIRNVSSGFNLLSTPHGFYFRMRVPLRYREHFKRREFKLALRTTDAKEAQRKALLLSALVSENIAQLDIAKGYRMSKLPLFNNLSIAEVEVSLQGIKIRGVEMDPHNIESETVAYRAALTGAREEYQNLLQQTPPDQITAPETPVTATVTAPTKLFAELIEDFVKEKTVSGSWNISNSNGRKEQLLRGLEHFGDCDISTITRDDAREFMGILSNLPPNLKKKKVFAGMSLKDIAAKNTRATISPKSVNMAMTDISSFFKWCVKCGYLVRNAFEGLSVKEESPAITQRLPYTHAELQQLFSDKIFQQHCCEPSEYFLPLLGLYHGARLNELCQLHTSDIHELEGIWVIDINDNDLQKSIKTRESMRTLPIHPELIRLNFVKYVQSLKPGRVFPNLKFNKGKFSGDYSKRFGTVRRRTKIIDKDYYSFRHLVSAELERLEIPEHLVASILGHQHPQITFGRYGEPKHVKRISSIMSQLKFNINVPPWPEQKIIRGKALQKVQETVPGIKLSDKSLDEVGKLNGKPSRRPL